MIGRESLIEININHRLEKTYNTQTYFSWKSLLWSFATFMFFSALLFSVVYIFRGGVYFVLIGFVVLFTAPFIFNQRLRNIFTRNTVVEFNNQSLSIKEYSLRSGNLTNEFGCRWEDIKYYKCAFSSGEYTTIIIHLKDGGNKSYLFKDNKTESESIDGESIFKIFYSYISRYNANKPLDEKIFLSPIFPATKFGKIFIILLAILGTVAILSQFLLVHNFLPMSLSVGVSLVLQLYLHRRDYKKTYDHIMQLDNNTHEINSVQ